MVKKSLQKTKVFFTKTFDKIIESEIEWQNYCIEHPISSIILALSGFGLGLVLRYYLCKFLKP